MRWIFAFFMYCSSIYSAPITFMDHFEPKEWVHVSIDEKQIEKCATLFASDSALHLPPWDECLPPGLSLEESVNFLLGLVAIDFCHWGLDGEKRYDFYCNDLDGNRVRRSMAMGARLKKMYREGLMLFEAPMMATVTKERLRPLLKGVDENGSEVDIPLLEERVEILNEIGAILLEKWEGSFYNVFLAGKGRILNEGMGFVELLVRDFPRYRDVDLYHGKQVGFYKLAQLSVIALHNAFDASSFKDCEVLTLCADYQIPKCLRTLGILHYSSELETRVREERLIPKGSDLEVELRMATIYADWLLKEQINAIRKERGDHPITSQELDYLLWCQGRKHGGQDNHHLTLTTMY